MEDLLKWKADLVSKIKDLEIAAEKTRLAGAWDTNDLIWKALFQMALRLDDVELQIWKSERAQPGYVSSLWRK